ncbi:hypothetical protein LIER_14440 [Lithospermum erythrorhizon]|uniref:Uncharacterized protein n=1 Tax=Lithospermum erythrorhizon TaxID=34254 RepID=A0AAV3PZ56_LITER
MVRIWPDKVVLGVGMNFMLLMLEFAAFVVVWKEVGLEIEFCYRKFWPENCRVDNRRRKTPSSPVKVAVDPSRKYQLNPLLKHKCLTSTL